jgi:MIP family channel proteins
MASRIRRCVVESLGTFALVVIGCGAAVVSRRTHAFDQAGVAMGFGAAVALIVAASGHLSGAHVNPAVTIGFWSMRRFPGRDVMPYVIAQCAGAIAASFTLAWVLGPTGGFGETVPSISVARAFVVEAGYSGLLAFVIMGVATEPKTPPGVAPFALGITVFAGALVTGPLTGGSFNPARSLGPAIASGVWRAHWVYWAAPIAGMMAAMHLYRALRGSESTERSNAPLGAEGAI